MGGLMGVGVCAGLDRAAEGAQIGSCGFGGELSGFSGGLTSVSGCAYAGCADRGPPGRTGVEFPFLPRIPGRASPLLLALGWGRLGWSADERT